MTRTEFYHQPQVDSLYLHMYWGLDIIYWSKRKGEVAALEEIPLVVETAV